jgi:3-oxoacyl-[acyl-carrier protein] reductase
MVERKWGRVVHLSTLSTYTYNGYAAYVSAKCALDGYVKTVSREVSKDNVIVSGVAPGAIYSEGRHFAKLQKENPAALEGYFKEHLSIKRLGRAEEIAPVAAFLCSDQASFMAGAIVGIDGGGM